jgi:hypothetical protein
MPWGQFFTFLAQGVIFSAILTGCIFMVGAAVIAVRKEYRKGE